MSTTEKISITIGRAELKHAKILASRLGLSLSTVITDAVREHVEAKARKTAGLAVLATFPAEDQPSEREMQKLLQAWGVPAQPVSTRSPASGTPMRRGSKTKPRGR